MNAYYNYGRWVVDCPADDCRAALRIGDEHSLVIGLAMVCDCQDESACDHQQIPCGHLFTAELPAEREAIEAITARRPRRANRNWLPGETVVDLKAENLRHGVKI